MAKYTKAMVERITALISADTYTQREICKIVGVDETIFSRWKRIHPEFADAIEAAESERMAKMVVEAKKSLMKKIQGYTVTETKITSIPSKEKDKKDGKQKGIIKEMVTTDKHFQPDTAAIIFTLTNGDPEHWKNRVNGELTGKDGKDLFDKMTDEEIEKRIRDFEKKAQ